MKTRYCISIIPSTSGMRQIYGANQGRRFYDEPEAARGFLKAVRECSGNRETLDRIYGPGAFDSLAVSPIECYDNGDAIGIFPSETIETDNMKDHKTTVRDQSGNLTRAFKDEMARRIKEDCANVGAMPRSNNRERVENACHREDRLYKIKELKLNDSNPTN